MRPNRWPLFALIALAGCGSSSAPLPTATAARDTLQAALDAWKGGKPAASLAEAKPKIEVVDFEWRAGKILTDFTIGAESTEQGTKSFSASLTIKGDPAPKDVRYMIFGIDPVQVYRDEDYTRAMNMDNNPTPPKKPAR